MSKSTTIKQFIADYDGDKESAFEQFCSVAIGHFLGRRDADGARADDDDGCLVHDEIVTSDLVWSGG